MDEVDGKSMVFAIFATVYDSETWSDVTLKFRSSKLATIGLTELLLWFWEPKNMIATTAMKTQT